MAIRTTILKEATIGGVTARESPSGEVVISGGRGGRYPVRTSRGDLIYVRSREEASKMQQAETQRRIESQRQAELKRKEKEINREMNQAILEARQQFAQDMRQVKGIQDRQVRLNQMQSQIRDAEITARQKKETAGVPTTKEKVKEFMEKTRLSKVAEVALIPIEKPISALAESERRQFAAGRGTEALRIRREAERRQEAKEKAERDIEKRLKDYPTKRIPVIDITTKAYRPETEQEYLSRTAPRVWRGLGGEYYKAAVPAVMRFLGKDPERMAVIAAAEGRPPSKISSILIGTTDILFKSVLFSPFMTTAVAKKAKAKAKLKQVKKTTKVKLTPREADELVRVLRTRPTDELRDVYKKALATGNRKTVKQVEALLEETMGQDRAVALFKEIKIQEGLMQPVGWKPYKAPKEPIISIDIQPKLPAQLPRVPETVTATGLFREYKVPTTRFDVMGLEKGKIDVIKLEEGRFRPLGVQPSRLAIVSKETLKQRQTLLLKQKEKIKEKAIVKSLLLQKTLQKAQEKQRQQARQVLGLVEVSKLKEEEKYRLKQRARLKLKPKYKYPYKPYHPFPLMPIPKAKPITPLKVPLPIKKKVQAWIAQVKRKGKWIPIGKPVVKPEAIRLGAEKVLKTLAATFRVRPVKELVAMKPIMFKPSPKVFRTYKIVKGKRVPLKEEWIQRRPFRLATRAERKEIQIARRVKQKKVKWL